MKIEPFVCQIKNVKYSIFENKIKSAEEKEFYVCSALVFEIGRGMAKVKTYHNVMFYLTPEEYDSRIIGVGDRIEIKESKWKCSSFELKSYNPQKIKEVNKSKLAIDEKGRPYYSEKVFAYKIKCNSGDWEIKYKMENASYCTVKDSRIKLPLEDEDHFGISDQFDWFLDATEMRILSQFNGKQVEVLMYSYGTQKDKRLLWLTTTRDDETNTNHLLLSGAEKRKNES